MRWNEGNMRGYINDSLTGFIIPFSCSSFLHSRNIAGHIYKPAMNLTPIFIANVTINKHLHQECCIKYHASHLFFADLSIFFTVVSIPVQSHNALCNRLVPHKTFTLIMYKKDLFFRIQKECTCHLF
jgi:hypothetical protein